ncbi:MAG: hypothetical protein ACLR3R_17460 [Clostridium paraputrificum]
MSKVKDILRIKEDVIFGGAIQADWYYDSNGEKAAENFVFHGPSYFGVLEDEVEYASHKLVDTCTFAENLVNKLCSDEGNPITMSIAGYGTGKSHLAVTLAKLISNPNKDISSKIISNIRIADSGIANFIKKSLNKPNLCIVLNGMKDFNLNYEIINNIKKALKQNGLSDEILMEFTKAYNIARTFLNRNYDRFESEFVTKAKKNNILQDNLNEYLLNNIFKDEVFDLINEVYKDINGDYIRWDEGITGAEIIRKLSEKLCGDNQPFNKIVIFFDEFGRYLEYVSAYPTRAGDAALQQIYDIVTSSENNILFYGFIQSDLKTYLARVNKSSNVSRYIGRYESGEKLYLSSNIETIFANIIEKHDKEAFKHYIKSWIYSEDKVNEYNRLFSCMQQWIQSDNKKGLWSSKDKFNNVIVEGIYPFHPLTTYLLTALSEWYQQRSALQFLINNFKRIEEKDIKELGRIPQVFGIDLLKGDLFKELLLAEEEGRQKGENCTVYEKITSKYDEKLNKYDKDILTAILGSKLMKFRISNRDEMLFLLQNLTGYSTKIIVETLVDLEENLGIISFDERTNTYDFIEDATGISDFNRFIRKKRNEIIIPLGAMINESIYEKIGLSNNIKTDFSARNHIKTSEWQFEQELLPIDDVNSNYFESFIKDFNSKTSVDKAKAKIVYAYYNNSYEYHYIERLIMLSKKYELKNYPMVIVLIDDKDNELQEMIISKTIINKITEEEKMKYSKFITKYSFDIDERLEIVFRELLREKQIITENGVELVSKRVSVYCNELLSNLYPNIIPFPFDGFDSKSITNAKKHFMSICSWLLLGNSVNEQGYHLLTREVKNRVEAVLRNSEIGWGVLDNKFQFIYPVNIKVKRLFDEIAHEMNEASEIKISDLYFKYLKSPYGLNDYSFMLMLLSYIIYQHNTIKVVYHERKYKISEWAINIFNDKSINLKALLSSKIIKVEIEGYELKYLDLCERIEKNNDVSCFDSLLFELENLILENDPPEELKSRVDGAKIRAEHGIKIFKNRENKIASLKGSLEAATENNDFRKIITSIKEADKLLVGIDDIYDFSITTIQENEVKNILVKLKSFLENNYLPYVKKVTCQSISQLSGFEKWMRILADDLRELKYTKLAQETKRRLQEVIDNSEKLKEIQLISQTCDVYLNVKYPNEYTSHEDLLAWAEEGERLVGYINNNAYIENIKKKQYINKLEERIRLLKKYLDGINEQIMDIFDNAFELKDVQACRELLNDIELVLAKKLRSKDKQGVMDLGNVIQNYINEITELDKEENLVVRKDNAELVLKRFEEEDDADFINVTKSYINSITIKIDELNSVWANMNLNIDIKEIEKWNSQQCIKWLDIWNAAPYYINYENINKGKTIYNLVIKRTKQFKMNSIIEIFLSLSNEEKVNCIKVLNEIVESK